MAYDKYTLTSIRDLQYENPEGRNTIEQGVTKRECKLLSFSNND